MYDSYAVDGVKKTLAQYWVDTREEGQPVMKYEINDTGDQDWYIQLKQENVTLEKDKWYKISFKIKSTLDRTVKYAMQHDGNSDPADAQDWTVYDGANINLTSDYQTYTNTFQMTGDTDTKVNFTISMGKITDQITEKHSVYIDDIVLEETEKPEEEENPGSLVEIGTDLIQNGDFADGNANWSAEINLKDAATAEFTDGKAVFDIVNVGEANWAIQMKQSGLAIEPGATYHLTMKLTSAVTRKIEIGLKNASSSIYYGGGVYDVTAGEAAEISADIVASAEHAANKEAYFILSLGKIGDNETPVGTVTIDSISLVKTAEGEISGGGEEGGDKPAGAELMKNSDFSEGEANWIKAITADGTGADATAEFTGGKAVYQIQNPGIANWNIQLKQEGIELQKDSTYQLKLKIKSSAARTVDVGFFGASDTWLAGQSIVLEAGELKEYSVNVTPIADNEASTFILSMGKVGDETPTGTIEIESISFIKTAGAQ